MINIKGKDKADVLRALYNYAKPQGMGYLHYNPKPMTYFEAETILKVEGRKGSLYFDYILGRVMKVDLTSDEEFDETLYDRDNGEGAAQRALDRVFNSSPIEKIMLE